MLVVFFFSEGFAGFRRYVRIDRRRAGRRERILARFSFLFCFGCDMWLPVSKRRKRKGANACKVRDGVQIYGPFYEVFVFAFLRLLII